MNTPAVQPRYAHGAQSRIPRRCKDNEGSIPSSGIIITSCGTIIRSNQSIAKTDGYRDAVAEIRRLRTASLRRCDAR